MVERTEKIRIEVLGIVKGLDKVNNQAKRLRTELSATQKMSKQMGISVDAVRNLFRQTGLQMSKSGKSIMNHNRSVSKTTQMWDLARKRLDSFTGVMGMNFEAWQGMNKQGIRFNTMGGRMANSLRKMTHGMKGFKMEMLGVMFFGMALYRTMSGLLRQSMEWAGVSEVLSAALGLLFLPIALQLLDWAIKFLEWVGQLSEEQKKLIGWIVLGAAAFGLFLMQVGQMALGLGSIIQLFSGIGGAASGAAETMVGAFSGSVAMIAAIIAVVVLIIIGMYLAWKENFLGMKDVIAGFIEAGKQYFSGFIEFFSGLFAVIKGLIMGDADMVVEGLKKIVEGFKNMIFGLIKMTINGVMAIAIGALRIATGIIQTIVNLFGKIPKLFGGEGFSVDWVDKLSGVKMPSFQTGGIVPGKLGNAVPIMAHAGERVVPVGGMGRTDTGTTNNTLSPNITINMTGGSSTDVFALTEEISRRMGSDFERLTNSRATF